MTTKVGPLPEDDPRKVVQEVNVRMVESRDHRTIHANGSVGGYNQFGEIYFGLFTERSANAETSKFQLLDDGTTNIVPEKTPETVGIVRELQAGIFMSPVAVRNLVALLVTTLNDLGNVMEEEQAQQAETVVTEAVELP